MLRYDRQIKPSLVALYDIRPGNGAGLFLQPRRLQSKAARIVCNAGHQVSSSDVLYSLHWLPVRRRIEFKMATLCFKAVKFGNPPYLNSSRTC